MSHSTIMDRTPDIFKCRMCYFEAASDNQLLKHVVRHHRFDPSIKVQCNEYGCGATFTNWKSFKQHVFRMVMLRILDGIYKYIQCFIKISLKSKFH